MSQIKGRVMLCLVIESTRRVLFQGSLNNVPSPIYCYSLALGGGVSVDYLTALRYFVQRVQQGSRLYFPGDLIFWGEVLFACRCIEHNSAIKTCNCSLIQIICWKRHSPTVAFWTSYSIRRVQQPVKIENSKEIGWPKQLKPIPMLLLGYFLCWGPPRRKVSEVTFKCIFNIARTGQRSSYLLTIG